MERTRSCAFGAAAVAGAFMLATIGSWASSGGTEERLEGTPEIDEHEPAGEAIVRQRPGSYLIDEIIGSPVESRSGDPVGEVDEILVTINGEVTGVVIEMGGFLGLGGRKIAIPFSRFDVQEDGEGLRFVLDMTEAELEELPQFMTTGVAEMEDEWERQERIESGDRVGGRD